MTPFQVYLLMQADSICSIAGFITVFSGIGFAITTIGRFATGSCVDADDIKYQRKDWRDWQALVKMHRWAMAIFFPALFLAIFMPNTKTIATMVVLPKITSPAAMNALGEKGEQLYSIAREALQGLADRAKPTPADDSKK